MRLGCLTWTAVVCLFSLTAGATEPMSKTYSIVPDAKAYAVNDQNDVAGTKITREGFEAFIYSGRTKKVRLLGALNKGGESEAWAINVHGDVVGYSSTPTNDGVHAFLYSKGKMHDLGTLGGKNSYATGINKHGVIVGYSDVGPNVTHAFIYENGQMQDIGTLGGSDSYAAGINEFNEIVGTAYLEDNIGPHAFAFSVGQMHDLGSLDGGEALGGTSTGTAINANGDVVGYSTLPDGETIHAFLYTNGGMVDLGTLNSGDGYSDARGINDHGVIAGVSGTQCYTFSQGQMTAIPKTTNGIAYGINVHGSVTGAIVNPETGTRHAFLYVR